MNLKWWIKSSNTFDWHPLWKIWHFSHYLFVKVKLDIQNRNCKMCKFKLSNICQSNYHKCLFFKYGYPNWLKEIGLFKNKANTFMLCIFHYIIQFHYITKIKNTKQLSVISLWISCSLIWTEWRAYLVVSCVLFPA